MALRERALFDRHAAAIDLLRQGREDDGLLLLSYVVWPSERLRSGAPRPTSRTARRRSVEEHRPRRVRVRAT